MVQKEYKIVQMKCIGAKEKKMVKIHEVRSIYSIVEMHPVKRFEVKRIEKVLKEIV